MATTPAGGTAPPRQPGTNNRRETARQSVVDSYLITVDLAFQSGALLLDLSETGIGVQALASVPVGTTTPVQFDLPEMGGHVAGVGRIAWTDNSGRLGILFDEIAEPSRLQLAHWLSRDRRRQMPSSPNLAVPSWPPAHTRDEIAALRRDLNAVNMQGDEALAFVVERMRSITRATGAAAALEDGGEIVCRASSGNAPSVGARVDPNSGLSGECVRTGEIVRCEDTETDPRADRLVCRRLELRSIVIVPIRVQSRTIGVLEAFSSRPHAFQSSDVLLLRRISDLVAGIAARHPESSSIAPGPPSVMASAEVLEPLIADLAADDTTPPIMEEILEPSAEEFAPPPAAVKAEPVAPVVTQAAVAPTQPAPILEKPAPAIKEPVVEATRIGVLIPSVAPSAPPVPPAAVQQEVKPSVDKRTERVAAPVETTIAAAEVRTPAPVARAVPAAEPITKPAPVSVPEIAKPAVMAAAASVAAPARLTPKPLPVPAEPTSDASLVSSLRGAMLSTTSIPTTTPSPWRLRITGAGILGAVLVIGGWQVWKALTPPKGTPMDSEINKATPAATLAVTPTAVPAPPVITPTAAVAASPLRTSPASAPPAALQPATVTAKPTAPPAEKAAPRPAAEPINLPPPDLTATAEISEAPPAIGLASRHAGEASPISNVLRAPIAAPALEPTRISQITGGKLISRVNPTYPSGAQGTYGEVRLKATINKDGKVSKIQIVRGNAVLAQAAANAVRRWRYEPYLLNGSPIEVESTVVINFKAPGR